MLAWEPLKLFLKKLMAFFRQQIHLDVQGHKPEELVKQIVLTPELFLCRNRSGVNESLCGIHGDYPFVFQAYSGIMYQSGYALAL